MTTVRVASHQWIQREFEVDTKESVEGIAAYVDYERRRKGLIDGLTLKNKGGEFMVSTEERVGCAEALASATDQGTAIALTYALKSDPEADVRATVASVMGIQRLSVYKPALEAALPKAQGEVKEAVAWALSEIDRDPVTPKAPELPPEVTQAANAKAPEAPKEGETAPEDASEAEAADAGKEGDAGKEAAAAPEDAP